MPVSFLAHLTQNGITMAWGPLSLCHLSSVINYHTFDIFYTNQWANFKETWLEGYLEKSQIFI